MKNSDEAIDRVLEGLRQATSPEGLTQRVHHALKTKTSKAPAWKPAWLFMPSPMRPFSFWPATIAAVAIIAIPIYWIVLRAPAKSQDRVEVAQPALASPLPPSQSAHSRVAQPAVVMATETTSTPVHVRQATYAEPRKTHAENHPLQEAPLTEEERILLRFAHQANPKLIEAYSPILRAKSNEEEKAAFDTFFDPPKTPAESNE